MNNAFYLSDPGSWKKRAMAFVIRSHRQLWGKNNEDPLAFLFKRGLKNEFAKQQYLGWNKFSQKRSLKNWGLEALAGQEDQLFLTTGIVVPYIVKKELISVFIYDFTGGCTLIPGSHSNDLILGPKKSGAPVVHDLMDGLLLFQQSGPESCVVIRPEN